MSKLELAAKVAEAAVETTIASTKLISDALGNKSVATTIGMLEKSAGGDLIRATAIKAEAQVQVLAGHAKDVIGKVFKVVPDDGGQMVAVVKLPAGSHLSYKAPVGELSSISPTLWRDNVGSLYRTAKPHVDDLPRHVDLKFAADMVAPELSAVKLAKGQDQVILGEISPLTGVGKHGDLVRASVGDRSKFLTTLSEAPQHKFSNSPLLDVRPKSIFNPDGATINCMACTAGVVRTLNYGEMVNASQVAKLRSPFGEFVGAPSVGRFRDSIEALNWFQKASGASIERQSSALGAIAPGRPHAVDIMLKGADGEQRHMAFAFKLQDGKSFVYDGQSGVRYAQESLNSSKLSMTFYELKAQPKPLYK